MIPDYTDAWLENGAHAATSANDSEGFIAQYVLPLFFRRATKNVSFRRAIRIFIISMSRQFAEIYRAHRSDLR